MEKMAPVVRFIGRHCTLLKERFPDYSKRSCWCIFDYGCIKQADFDFGLNELEELLQQFICFFHCCGSGLESDTGNAYNNFKFSERNVRSKRQVNLGDEARICFSRHEKFSTSICFLQIFAFLQGAECKRGFSLMNRIKTKNRYRLEL